MYELKRGWGWGYLIFPRLKIFAAFCITSSADDDNGAILSSSTYFYIYIYITPTATMVCSTASEAKRSGPTTGVPTPERNGTEQARSPPHRIALGDIHYSATTAAVDAELVVAEATVAVAAATAAEAAASTSESSDTRHHRLT